MFAIQSEIARAIAEAIRKELGIEYELSWFQSIHETSDVRAYELYKTGYHLMWPLLTEEGIRKGIEYFEQALAIDPDYAQARVELGFAYLGRWNHGRVTNDLALAREEAERVLASDPTNGGAHNLLAWILQRRHQWEEAQRTVERGLAHNPGHSALLSQSSCLMALHGRSADALVQAHRAVDLDPRFAPFHLGLGTVEVLAGEFGAAVEDLEHTWELAPGASAIRTWLAYAYHMSGRDAEALEAAVRDLPDDLSGLESAMRQGFEKTGFAGAMRVRHEWLVARNGTRCSDEALYWGGDPLATLGEGDAVFECLQMAIDRGDLLYLRANPLYDPYRADPRFAALLRRMNLAE